MDEISAQPPENPVQQNTPTANAKKPGISFSINALPKSLKIGLGAALLFLLTISLIIIVAVLSQNKTDKKILDSNPDEEINSAKKDQAEKDQKEASASTPINQLQAIYSDVVGSNTFKRKLEISDSGVVTIDYTIPSTEGQTVIKISYENFADFAVKVFNIPSTNRLNVTIYATKFTDQFGQPDQPALKLQITKETNAKINWPIKKFAYADYKNNLDLHEMNALLQKDYELILKKSN